jgi:aldehyde dehydrogenase (NAD+)
MSATTPEVARWCTTLTIDGEQVAGAGEPRPVYDPATEEILAAPADATLEQCDAAIAAAGRALTSPAWTDPSARAADLGTLADVLYRHAEELAIAQMREVGTPISTSHGMQVATPIRILRRYAELAGEDRTVALPTDDFGVRTVSRVSFRPVGVVGAITAYNAPLLLALNKVGAALAAGCTVVLMPSPLAPLTILRLGELAAEAGLPPGVLNVVAGGPDVGRRITAHAGVAAATFTGSVPVGREVMRQAADHVTNIVLELGGKSPAIVLPSADLEEVARPLHERYCRNAGQGCSAPTRLLVPQDRMTDFVDLTRAVFAGIAVGDPAEPTTLVGPLISAPHRDRVEDMIAAAIASGGQVAAGGGRPDTTRGWYLNPALVTGVDNTAPISRDELFGPVAVALPYRDVEEAIEIANDTALGLHAMVYGETEEAGAVAERLRAGQVTVNGGGGFRTDAPLGGFKQSGIGRESGEWGVREFLEPQHIQRPVAG